MKMSTRLFLPSFIAAATLGASAAWACSCVRPQSPEAQLTGVPLVIVARAEWTRHEQGKPARYAVTRFTVLRTLKGPRRAHWRIAHHQDEATCGLDFQPGQSVILLVRSSDGRAATSLCDQAHFPLAAYEQALAGR